MEQQLELKNVLREIHKQIDDALDATENEETSKKKLKGQRVLRLTEIDFEAGVTINKSKSGGVNISFVNLSAGAKLAKSTSSKLTFHFKVLSSHEARATRFFLGATLKPGQEVMLNEEGETEISPQAMKSGIDIYRFLDNEKNEYALVRGKLTPKPKDGTLLTQTWSGEVFIAENGEPMPIPPGEQFTKGQ